MKAGRAWCGVGGLSTQRALAHAVRFGLLVALLGAVAACDDEGGTGTGDTCVGPSCGETDFNGNDTSRADTFTGTDTSPTDTAVTTCSVGQVQCEATTPYPTLRLCINGQWEETLCIDSVCDPSAGQCRAAVCPVPNQPFQCENADQERVCSADQLSYTLRHCTGDDTCLATRCGVQVCTPGAKRCRNASTPEQCSEDGSGWTLLDPCAENEVCGGSGVCQSMCELNAKTSSFLGCDYYVVDMDNADASAGGDPTAPSTDDQPFGITISNPNTTLTARVNIVGGGQTTSVDVAPNDLELVQLPSTTDVDNSGLFSNATFHVVSSIPVTVHQFNPVNGVGVFSNDASLLLPVNALGRQYTALNWPSTPTVQPQVYIDIVATEDNTTVDITTPVAIPASGSFGAIAAGGSRSFTMNSGQLLHLLNDGTEGSDLSGLTIMSSAPVAVFAGTRCMISTSNCCCDHTEQQLFPVEAWDTHYIAAKSATRGSEVDFWRIIATIDSTDVTLTPAVSGVSTFSLDAGEVYDIATTQDFEVAATKKVLVGQFWASSNDPGVDDTCVYPADILGMGACDALTCTLFAGGTCVGNACAKACTNEATCDDLCGGDQACIDGLKCLSGYCSFASGIGDPAYSLAVPVGQYRQDYIVLTPVGYQENYMTIIARRGSVPSMDGAQITAAPLSATATPLNTDWDIYRFPVAEGVHQLQGSTAFGVVAYGYNCDVSYAYPGGLNLEIIN